MADEAEEIRRCATHDMSAADRGRMMELENNFTQTARLTETALDINIPVAFIHITDGGAGQVTDQMRSDQIALLNQDFAPAGITFHQHGDPVVHDDPAWFRMGHLSARERDCKTALQVLPPEEGLNFYTAQPGGGLLGWATFPYQMEGDPIMDGVVMLHDTLPGGGNTRYGLGKTAIHEVGHWFGLYHTFQDGCTGLGDQVDDTPAHSGPNYGTPSDSGQPHNLCPDEVALGKDCPIHNIMNYVDDVWMTEPLTAGQNQRIVAQISMFRRGLLGLTAAGRSFESNIGEPAVVW